MPIGMWVVSCYPRGERSAAGGTSRPLGALRVLGVALAAEPCLCLVVPSLSQSPIPVWGKQAGRGCLAECPHPRLRPGRDRRRTAGGKVGQGGGRALPGRNFLTLLECNSLCCFFYETTFTCPWSVLRGPGPLPLPPLRLDYLPPAATLLAQPSLPLSLTS